MRLTFILKSLNINLGEGLRTKLLWDHYTHLRDENKSVTDKKIDLKKFKRNPTPPVTDWRIARSIRSLGRISKNTNIPAV